MKFLQPMISKTTSFHTFLLAFVVMSAVSCKITAPTPEMTEIEIPAGPPQGVSHINIPVNISIDPILKFANESSSPIIRNPEWPNFASFGACDGPQAKYDVFRENLNGYVVGNKVTLAGLAFTCALKETIAPVAFGEIVFIREFLFLVEVETKPSEELKLNFQPIFP